VEVHSHQSLGTLGNDGVRREEQQSWR
jgi:hypothetical protein